MWNLILELAQIAKLCNSVYHNKHTYYTHEFHFLTNNKFWQKQNACWVTKNYACLIKSYPNWVHKVLLLSVSLRALFTTCACVLECSMFLLGVGGVLVRFHLALRLYACVSRGSGLAWGGQTLNGQMIQVLHSSSINYQLITVMQPI